MYSTNTNHRQTSGFTLVEMLVIAPIVILFIGGVVAFIISLVGDTLVSSERNTMTWQIQSSLDQIESDVRLATSINSTSGTMPSPQGNGGGTTAFSGTSALILTQLATTKNPYDTSRSLIYLANPASACGTNAEYINPALTIQVIYFISGGTLYRRVSYPLPTAATCGSVTPWQINSCSAIGASPCLAKDQALVPNVTMGLEYFTGSTSTATTATPSVTTSTRVTLTVNRTIAGSNLSSSGVMSATRLNGN